MSKAATSIAVFGGYIFILGALCTVAPDIPYWLLGIPSGGGWPRLVAALVTVLGAYYLVAARHQLVPFFRATVWGRAGVVVFGVATVLTGEFPPAFLLLLVPDLLGAIWTALALRDHVASK
jgi:hypothetical protein